jgi:hypothetical protein
VLTIVYYLSTSNTIQSPRSVVGFTAFVPRNVCVSLGAAAKHVQYLCNVRLFSMNVVSLHPEILRELEGQDDIMIIVKNNP